MSIADVTIQDGTLMQRWFVWNDDCPAWPVHLTSDTNQPERLTSVEARAYVAAPVLLAMIRAVATNKVNGMPFVDDEDAIESCARLGKVERAWYGNRLVYDVSPFVINTGSMEPDIIEAAGFENLEDPNAHYQSGYR